ncbi:MAG: ABC transporter ATP-binding protein/permease, partial [Lachnospiraceae bacterium]|nr:ABC transporter ATP-binding protein/permease [Lachnospiraceae bacterium]
RAEIVFEHVSFRYPGSSIWALQDISFAVQAGEKLALVGQNGSGKTTLVKLLCRLYRPTQGRILFCGMDIWSYPWEEYREKLAAVFQDFSLFAFPVAENVAASECYDKTRIEYALKEAGVFGKVECLPEGIHQPLFHDFMENGCDLSGGEAQKIAIARAIYRDAQVMVLDEPTAALDPFAEAEIYENFRTMSEGKTAFLVSHRLSSCKSCDCVAVFLEGRLVQFGSHEELVKRAGEEYSRLWEAQAQYYA